MAQFDFWFKLLILLFGLLGLTVNIGCAPDMEPIERTANKAFDTVIEPAMSKALTELDTRNLQIQGQMSGINPGYVIEGYGIFGTGVLFKMTLRLDGVSANIAGAGQADQGPDLGDATE